MTQLSIDAAIIEKCQKDSFEENGDNTLLRAEMEGKRELGL